MTWFQFFTDKNERKPIAELKSHVEDANRQNLVPRTRCIRHVMFRAGLLGIVVATVMFIVGFSTTAWLTMMNYDLCPTEGLWRIHGRNGCFEASKLGVVRAAETLCLSLLLTSIVVAVVKDFVLRKRVDSFVEKSRAVEILALAAGTIGLIGITVYGAYNHNRVLGAREDSYNSYRNYYSYFASDDDGDVPSDYDPVPLPYTVLSWSFGLAAAACILTILSALALFYGRGIHTAHAHEVVDIGETTPSISGVESEEKSGHKTFWAKDHTDQLPQEPFRRIHARHPLFRLGCCGMCVATVIFMVGFSSPAWYGQGGLWRFRSEHFESDVSFGDGLDHVRALESLCLIFLVMAGCVEMYQDYFQMPPAADNKFVEIMSFLAGIFGLTGVVVFGVTHPNVSPNDCHEGFYVSENYLNWAFFLTTIGVILIFVFSILIAYSRVNHAKFTRDALNAAEDVFKRSGSKLLEAGQIRSTHREMAYLLGPFSNAGTSLARVPMTSQVPTFYVIEHGTLIPVYDKISTMTPGTTVRNSIQDLGDDAKSAETPSAFPNCMEGPDLEESVEEQAGGTASSSLTQRLAADMNEELVL